MPLGLAFCFGISHSEWRLLMVYDVYYESDEEQGVILEAFNERQFSIVYHVVNWEAFCLTSERVHLYCGCSCHTVCNTCCRPR